MLDLMIGHRQINKYGECSIFIFRSDLLKRMRLQFKSESQLTVNDTESESDGINIDYDDSNYYMQTFLTKFGNSSSQ